MKDFMILFRADASLRLPQGKTATLRLAPAPNLQVELEIATNYSIIQGQDQDPIPGPLEILVKCRAESIQSALNTYNKLPNFCANILALAANAAVNVIELSRVWDCTDGDVNRPFLCAALPALQPQSVSRLVDLDAFTDFVNGLLNPDKPKDTARLIRACAQYRLALHSWNADLPLSHAHLFIGMEALVPVALRREMERTGITDKALLFGTYGINKDLPMGKKNQLLDAAIRSGILFQRDLGTHKAAKDASDGYEHGFLELDEIERLAARSREQTAQYLRHAILTLAADSTKVDPLLRDRFSSPNVPVLLVGLEGTIKIAPDGDARSELASLAPSLSVVGNKYNAEANTYERSFTVTSLKPADHIEIRGVRSAHYEAGVPVDMSGFQ